MDRTEYETEVIRIAIRDLLKTEVWFDLGDSKELNVVLARTAVAQSEVRITERRRKR